MFEERTWGNYQVIDISEFSDKFKSLTKKLIILPDKNISYQSHRCRSEVWVVVDGVGEIVIDGVRKHVHRDDVITIDVGQKHVLRSITKMTIIEVQQGENLVEEDIERFEYEW